MQAPINGHGNISIERNTFKHRNISIEQNNFKKGNIITFYSYKGGVGRTQLVANIAAYLCHKENKKVLLIDFDLEAPGLHFYFKNQETNKNWAYDDFQSEGLIDVFNQYVALRRSKSNIETKEELPLIQKDIHIKKLNTGENEACVDILPAGKYGQFNDYRSQVVGFNWYEFYELLEGKFYIERFKEHLKTLDYDYIFIDSRTGLSDYSNICNIQLPNFNVLVMGPNEQNIDGCINVGRMILESPYLQNATMRKAGILPILSRIDSDADEYSEFYINYKEKTNFLIQNLESTYRQFSTREFSSFFEDITLYYNRNRSIGETQFYPDKNAKYASPHLGVKYANVANFLRYFCEEITITQLRNIVYGTEELLSKFLSTADSLFNNENYEAAVKIYESVVEIEPNNIDVLSKIAYCYLELNNLDKSLETILKALEIDSNNINILNNLGIVYRALNQHDKSINIYNKILETNPNDEDVLCNLGRSYTDLAQYDKAINSYNKVLEISPNNEKVLNNLGNTYSDLAQYDKAINAYSKSLEIKPNHEGVLINLCAVYIYVKDYNKALEYIKKAFAINPNNPNILFNYACTLSNLKDKKQALSFLEKAIQLDEAYRQEATTDDDFKWLHNDADFQKIVGLVPA